eukprot:16438712-Heterocapsa_arctica.AAC.1
MPQVRKVALKSPETPQVPKQRGPAPQSLWAQVLATPASAASVPRAHPRWTLPSFSRPSICSK